jgi:hypothetical protein
MSNLGVKYAFELAKDSFSKNTQLQFSFIRDNNDEYALVPLTEESSAKLDYFKPLLIKLIPAGSHWSSALGWSSYFGIGLNWKRNSWIILGVEGILPHKTRKAHYSCSYFIFPYDSTGLEKAKHSLAKLRLNILEGISYISDSTKKTLRKAKGRFLNRIVGSLLYGIQLFDIKDPSTYRIVEIWVIDSIISRIEKRGNLTNFQTLIFHEQQYILFNSLDLVYSNKRIRTSNYQFYSKFSSKIHRQIRSEANWPNPIKLD